MKKIGVWGRGADPNPNKFHLKMKKLGSGSVFRTPTPINFIFVHVCPQIGINPDGGSEGGMKCKKLGSGGGGRAPTPINFI